MMQRKIFIMTAVMFLSLAVAAQELPKLPADPAVKHGVLPNGMTWYIASNRSSKKMADFALVQKTGTNQSDESGDAVTVAKDALAHIQRLVGNTPQKMLTSKGVAPGKHGFVEVTDNATVFRFKDVLLSDDISVTDSTLLLIFSITDRITGTEDEFIRKWYAPADQAIVISGDVDVEKMMSRLYCLSLMTPSYPSSPRKEYVWTPAEGPVFAVQDDAAGNPSVSFTWKFQRTPEIFMDTVQPAIFEMIMSELGVILSESVRDNMTERGKPVAGVKWRYVPSARTSGDESFTMTVTSAPEYLPDVLEVMCGSFSAVNAGKTSVRAFSDARQECIASLAKRIASPVKDNADYVDRCISSFLYNSSLASVKEKYDYYSSKEIADTTELRLFNGVVSALLSDRKNLSVVCRNSDGTFTDASLKDGFEKAWETMSLTASACPEPESVYAELPELDDKKFKVVSTKTDNASQSSIFVFSNGFTVVYRRMPADGNMFFSLSLNGGYGNMPELVQGEGGFVSDYLDLCLVNGCPGNEFFAALREDGIYMRPTVGLSEMKVAGVSPAGKFPQVMNALVSIFNERKPNPAAFGHYLQEQRLRQRYASAGHVRMAKIDSIICPDNKYTSFRNAEALTPAFMMKAEKFFNRQSEKMNDGVLVLVGDMDESRLKKMLLGYVGQFYTEQKASSRAQYRYRPVTGTSVYTVNGDEDCIDIVMNADYPMTAENTIAVEIARIVIRRRLAAALADTGMYMDVSMKMSLHPNEMVGARISAKMADVDGFASGMEQTGPIRALIVMRSCLAGLDGIKISDAELNACKEYIKGKLAIQTTNPAWWLDVLSRRYIEGKDMYSNVIAKVDAVTPAKVSSVLTALGKGSRVEYVTSAGN